jgi:hypothetical protein
VFTGAHAKELPPIWRNTNTMSKIGVIKYGSRLHVYEDNRKIFETNNEPGMRVNEYLEKHHVKQALQYEYRVVVEGSVIAIATSLALAAIVLKSYEQAVIEIWDMAFINEEPERVYTRDMLYMN